MRRHVGVLVVAFLAVFAGYASRDLWLPRVLTGFGFLTGSADPSQPAVPPSPTRSRAGRPAGGGTGPVAVTVAVAASGSLPIRRTTIGSVVPVASTVLTAPVSGIVTSVAVRDGQVVQKGTLITQLDDRAAKSALAKDQASLAKDQATLEDANMTLSRIESEVAKDAATKQSLDDAQAAAHVAAAAAEMDKAQIAVDRVVIDNARIVAPYDGQLGVVAVSPGALVTPGTPVVTLTQMKPVFAEFTMAETDLALARQAMTAGDLMVQVAPVLAKGGGGENGAVFFIDNSIDGASRTFRLRARLANTDEALWPGQSLNVIVTAGVVRGLVLIPSVAVQVTENGAAVYVIGNDNKAAFRPVTVALSVGDKTGISAGLRAGERVVTEGQGVLADGTPVRIVNGVGGAAMVNSQNGGAHGLLPDANATGAVARQQGQIRKAGLP